MNDRWKIFIKDGMAQASSVPSVSKSDKILAMGSCFAVEIRKALLSEGYNLLPKNLFGFIWYTPLSIEQEVLLAFGEKKRAPGDIWRSKDGKFWQDPYRRFVFAESKSELMAKINLHDKMIRDSFLSADKFIFTMGLTEAWTLESSGMSCCLEPLTRRDPKINVKDIIHDAKFTPISYSRCLKSIDNIAKTIKKHRGDKDIIMTVSPVPLNKTYRKNIDVSVANCESKSIIKVAVAEAQRRNKNIFYFPSYEIVSFMGKDAFKPDRRHVRPEVVKRIMDNFLRVI